MSHMSVELMAFLRYPRAHVYSQYLELVYDDQWGWRYKNKFKREIPTFTKFLEFFTSGEGTNHSTWVGYHPQDLQTRSLVCEGVWSRLNGYYNLTQGDLVQALENVENYKFIGITEFFQASVCVYIDKMQPDSLLPDFCDCQNSTKWSSFPFVHVKHGVPKHSLNDLSKTDQLMIDSLTQMDLKVYKAGLQRFYREVSEIEQRRGLRIHCN